MHRHDNTCHPADLLPLQVWPGETFTFPDGRTLLVEPVVADVLGHPERYACIEIELATLAAQIRGSSKLNFHRVATLERDRARRPLLLARTGDGELLLLDGRHRAARSLQLGYRASMAWLLEPEQLAAFRGA